MADLTEKRVNAVLLYLTGSYPLAAAITDHTSDLIYNGYTFKSETEADFSSVAALSMDMQSDECEIKNIPVNTQLLVSNLFARHPYKEVGVLVYSFELDGSGEVIPGTVWTIWKGLLFSVKAHLSRNHISIVSRNDKFYSDRLAGLVCVEQCVVAYFGDALCKKTVVSNPVTIIAISGNSVSFSSAPPGVDFLYRSGYLSYLGLDIKVVDWTDTPGTYAVLTSPPPISWLNQEVTIYSGCDRTYETCRDIHDNTTNMLPLGISMVDYNVYFESE